MRATADIIEHKWATLIVRDLLSGRKRFSELERSLAPIRPKVLSERLRELESRQLVQRTVLPTVPPSTEYALTPLGLALEEVIRAMQRFGERLLAPSGPPAAASKDAAAALAHGSAAREEHR